MTKKQIKYAIQRGLGRGILAVRKDPERYRDLVLWACVRNLAYDTQSEGTRTWYDYQLISCYADRTEFRDQIISRFRQKKPDGGWDYSHFSELLMFFAEDGDLVAEAVLWEKYAELLCALQSIRREGRPKWQTRECFETLCIALSRSETNYARIAADLGSLFLRSKLYDAWDFEWLYDSQQRNANAQLRRKAAASLELTAWFAAFDALAEEEKMLEQTRFDSAPPEGGRRLSVYLKRITPELAPSYAEAYLTEEAPEARAAALEAFAVCPYPLDPTPVLADAASAHPALREAALDALTVIRHPMVRWYAWEHLEEDPDRMLPIAIKNYLPEDEAVLQAWIADYRTDYHDRTNWHWLHTEILDLFDRDSGVKKPPKSLLPVLYETTLCSCCRETVVRLMGKYRMISETMWEELSYDSNEGIRNYAAAHERRELRAGKDTDGLENESRRSACRA